MKTLLTTDPGEAADFIKRGGIVAFPTETVYGLGANVFDEKAVAAIFGAKRRPADNPLIAHIAGHEQIAELASEVSSDAQKLMDAFFPGPLTIVLRKTEQVPLIATAGHDTIGVRMPGFDLANRFLAACVVPVVAPSANLSGRPSPTTWEAVMEDLDGRIDCILQAEPTEIGLESTVVDCTANVPLLLRAGSVSLEDLRKLVPGMQRYQVIDSESPKSPGLKHRHYSPAAKVVLIDQSDISQPEQSGFIGIRERGEEFALAKRCSSVEDYAHSLFEFFRECDRRGIEVIYCETVDETGIGFALMDRLRRAADAT